MPTDCALDDCAPTPADPDAILAGEALPAAFAAYMRAARALRAARVDFTATLIVAGDDAASALFTRPTELESLFGAMNCASNEAQRLAALATHVGTSAIKSEALSGHDVNVCVARGQAREMTSCERSTGAPCGACAPCLTCADDRAADRDPLEALAARILAKLEPSGLIAPDGAPLTGPAANRHARRTIKSRTGLS